MNLDHYSVIYLLGFWLNFARPVQTKLRGKRRNSEEIVTHYVTNPDGTEHQEILTQGRWNSYDKGKVPFDLPSCELNRRAYYLKAIHDGILPFIRKRRIDRLI